MNSFLRLFLLSSVCGLLACDSGPPPVDDESPDAGALTPDAGVCAGVGIWHARPSWGGGCRYFATPCDVPQGYVMCCGGLSYGGCPRQGQACVDDPTDTCDPQRAMDCSGICQP
jgi:hypothetical protein